MQIVSFLRLPEELDTWLLTSDHNGIAFEDLQLVHFSLGHLNNGVVILFRVLDLEFVRRFLLIKDGGGKVFLYFCHLEIDY